MEISQEETNFLKITSLVLEIAPDAVRHLFDSYIYPFNLPSVLQQKAEKLRMLHEKHIINEEQWMRLFPAHAQVKSSNFDQALMILLLREISAVEAPTTGWNKLPETGDDSLGADLVRIRHYRNTTIHASTFSINEHDFEKIWSELEMVIINVGGNGFTAQIETLLTRPLDRSPSDYIRELEALKNEEEVIPANIQRLNDITFRLWADEESDFVHTHIVQEVTRSSQNSNFILVSGPQESGKSTTVHHIALQFKEKGYRVCPVKSPKEILDYWIQGSNQIFVFDDPFGKHEIDIVSIKQWQTYLYDIKLCYKYSPMIILASVRANVTEDKQIKGLISQIDHKILTVSDKSDSERVPYLTYGFRLLFCLFVIITFILHTWHMRECNLKFKCRTI